MRIWTERLISHTRSLSDFGDATMEIIGNINENPELLQNLEIPNPAGFSYKPFRNYE